MALIKQLIHTNCIIPIDSLQGFGKYHTNSPLDNFWAFEWCSWASIMILLGFELQHDCEFGIVLSNKLPLSATWIETVGSFSSWIYSIVSRQGWWAGNQSANEYKGKKGVIESEDTSLIKWLWSTQTSERTNKRSLVKLCGMNRSILETKAWAICDFNIFTTC